MVKKRRSLKVAQSTPEAKAELRSEAEINKEYSEVCQAIVTIDMQKATADLHLVELRRRVLLLAQEMDLAKAQPVAQS